MLFMAAVIIGSASLLYTNYLVDKLDHEERKKIEQWAEATYQLANSGMGPVNNALATRIIQLFEAPEQLRAMAKNATALASPAAANAIANLAEGLITKPKTTNSGVIA
mgnify:CR=1 FL=1